jgi:hypothetical protein
MATLFELNQQANNGRGVQCVRDIILEINKRNFESAAAIVNNEWDKIRNYPEIAQWLIDNGYKYKYRGEV